MTRHLERQRGIGERPQFSKGRVERSLLGGIVRICKRGGVVLCWGGEQGGVEHVEGKVPNGRELEVDARMAGTAPAVTML